MCVFSHMARYAELQVPLLLLMSVLMSHSLPRGVCVCVCVCVCVAGECLQSSVVVVVLDGRDADTRTGGSAQSALLVPGRK